MQDFKLNYCHQYFNHCFETECIDSFKEKNTLQLYAELKTKEWF